MFRQPLCKQLYREMSPGQHRRELLLGSCSTMRCYDLTSQLTPHAEIQAPASSAASSSSSPFPLAASRTGATTVNQHTIRFDDSPGALQSTKALQSPAVVV